MARPVDIRASYRDDSAYLIRFEKAVAKDEAVPKEHRDKMLDLAHQLAILCMQADNLRNPKK